MTGERGGGRTPPPALSQVRRDSHLPGRRCGRGGGGGGGGGGLGERRRRRRHRLLLLRRLLRVVPREAGRRRRRRRQRRRRQRRGVVVIDVQVPPVEDDGGGGRSGRREEGVGGGDDADDSLVESQDLASIAIRHAAGERKPFGTYIYIAVIVHAFPFGRPRCTSAVDYSPLRNSYAYITPPPPTISLSIRFSRVNHSPPTPPE